MTIKFTPINKYTVAISMHNNLNIQFLTHQLMDRGVRSSYQALPVGEIDDMCIVDTLDQLVVMFDDMENANMFGNAGESVKDYTLIPVTFTVTVENCSLQIQEANLSIKRIKALAKLTNEDKLVLGITE